MPEPIFLRLRDEFTPTSNSELYVELPTFPLSYLKLVVRRQQPSANTNITVDDLVSFISRVAVLVRGASVFDLDGRSAFAVGSMLYCKSVPYVKRPLSSATSQHIAAIYVPFSRKPLMPTSGIKQVARGESYLYLRFGTVPANTGLSIYVVGWRENDPDWTVKVSRYTQTVSAAGPVDVILAPVGPILGMIFREDNPYETALTSLLSEVRLMLQGVEDTIISYDMRSLLVDTMLTTFTDLDAADHLHVENTAAAYTQNATTLSQHTAVSALQRYAALMFDELYDPDAIIAVPPGMDCRLRCTATATGTLDVILVEMFTIPERPTGAGAGA
ncbi:MAG: hypothetical protein QXG57_06195 [Thermofilaceae archaeon]